MNSIDWPASSVWVFIAESAGRALQRERKGHGFESRWSPKNFFRVTSQLLKLRFVCDGHVFISLVFPHSTSFHSVFHSFHGLMNSINWPASSVWVFIAQLVEHCSANAEATGSNPVEARKTFFGLPRKCLNCDSTALITYSFQTFSCRLLLRMARIEMDWNLKRLGKSSKISVNLWNWVLMTFLLVLQVDCL